MGYHGLLERLSDLNLIEDMDIVDEIVV